MEQNHENHVVQQQQRPQVIAPQAGPVEADTPNGLWVFGYGSLCWHPGFEYHRSVTGYVKGYARKFWQGNTTHRGTETNPGRVATLIEDTDAIVWGRAFEISGEAALPYLAMRECKLGGYITKFATFYPRASSEGDDAAVNVPVQPFPALLYVATPNNSLWLGDAPLPDIASQIVSCSGATGHNVEYLLRLAEYMRICAPEADDEHLFTLEFLVRQLVDERRLSMDLLMGTYRQDCPNSQKKNEGAAQGGPAEGPAAGVAQPQEVARPETFEFAARMPPKKLRCLNI